LLEQRGFELPVLFAVFRLRKEADLLYRDWRGPLEVEGAYRTPVFRGPWPVFRFLSEDWSAWISLARKRLRRSAGFDSADRMLAAHVFRRAMRLRARRK